MFSEIQSILSDPSNQPTIDTVAAVAYVSYQQDQWVSLDTTETFALKMNYANSQCLGGTMVWSLDQDDGAYTALSGLYPSITGNNVASNQTECYTTQCGASSCAPGSIVSTTLYSPLKGICSAVAPALVCCPQPKNLAECTKRGWMNDATPCQPECLLGETLIAQDIVGNTTSDVCISGNTAICCNTDVPVPNGCTLTACSASPSTLCSVGSGFVTSVSPPGSICPVGTAQALCCPNPFPYSNCAWHGTPPFCDDAACGLDQITVISDLLGDGSQPCSGSGKRVYCCDTPVVLPTSFSNIFPNGTAQGSEVFYVEFDNDIEYERFRRDSPNEGSVSSMNLASNWVILDCDATSTEPQQVVAYCSKHGDPACSHVHISTTLQRAGATPSYQNLFYSDGAPNTVIELPNSCGAGPYARIISFEVHANQSILSTQYSTLKPASENVYLLHFDYNFLAIPASNGPIYMRADVTDMPGYWLEERALDQPLIKRWWGSFSTWLSKINTVKQDLSDKRDFVWQDTLQIFRESVHCDGPPQIDASLEVSLTGSAKLNARYGFYFQGTIVPPAVTASYLYFSSDASVSATTTIQGQAGVTYDSTLVTFGTFGFPGLSYPGLITIGPSLVLQGYIDGQLSLSGTLTIGANYDFPVVSFSLGHTGTDVVALPVTPLPPTNGFDYDFGYEVELSGDISVHMVPSIQLGVSVLGGKLIDAQTHISADISAGVALNGSVSNTLAPQICVIPHFGAELTGGITGSLLYWETSSAEWSFYDNAFTFGDKCWTSIMEPSINTKRGERSISASQGVIPPSTIDDTAHLQISTGGETRTLEPAEANFLPRNLNLCPGFVDCPVVKSGIGGVDWDNDIYRYMPDNNVNDDTIYRRSTTLDTSSSFDNISAQIHPIVDVKVATCQGIDFQPYDYGNAGVPFFHLANRNALDGDIIKAMIGNPGTKYAREHVYEMQLIAGFIDSLFSHPDLWHQDTGVDPNPTEFCTWVTTFIKELSAYRVPATWPAKWAGTSMVDRLKRCVPSNSKSFLKSMPMLESTQNGIKALAFGNKVIRRNETYNTYDFPKKIFVARSTVGVGNYLLNPYVQAQFVAGSNCVKAVWESWQADYRTDPTAAPHRMLLDIPTIYTTWITAAVDQVIPNLLEGLTTMIDLYAESATASDRGTLQIGGSAATTVDVIISTTNLNGGGGQPTPVSANTLKNDLLKQLMGIDLGAISGQL
ncbi:hypothetical protein C8R44DRAFT_882668 [Mycena epipterygia]|nr:hypothetical protein C8R44DRAFT_882668 [Mycena epipterygia]